MDDLLMAAAHFVAELAGASDVSDSAVRDRIRLRLPDGCEIVILRDRRAGYGCARLLAPRGRLLGVCHERFAYEIERDGCQLETTFALDRGPLSLARQVVRRLVTDTAAARGRVAVAVERDESAAERALVLARELAEIHGQVPEAIPPSQHAVRWMSFSDDAVVEAHVVAGIARPVRLRLDVSEATGAAVLRLLAARAAEGEVF